jgi:hypothetical protein
MRSLVTTVVLASLSLVSAVGCATAAEPDDGSQGASAVSQDPRGSLVKDAESVILSENGTETVLGAPSKIKSALASIDGRVVALPAAPRCGPPRFLLTINGADRKKLATVSVCETDKAFLQVGTKWYETPLAEPALRAVLAKKPLVGDLLLSATEVALNGAQGLIRRQSVSLNAAAFDLDAEPVTRVAAEVARDLDRPGCAPLMSLYFTKGSTDVATVTVFCPVNASDTAAPARLFAKGNEVGWVTYDLTKADGAL